MPDPNDACGLCRAGCHGRSHGAQSPSRGFPVCRLEPHGREGSGARRRIERSGAPNTRGARLQRRCPVVVCLSRRRCPGGGGRGRAHPLDKLIDTLGKGAGSSWYFVHRAPNMARGTFPPGFRVRLHAKDLTICRDMAARFGVTLPVVERMLDEYAELIARGYGDEDISAAFRLKAELFEPAGKAPRA